MWGTMGRQERPLDPAAGPLQAFAHDLRQLRRGAGSPGYRALARRAGYSASVLSTAANGSDLPSLPVVLAYVGACRGDVKAWEWRWQELAKLAAEWERPAAGPRGRRARPTEGASPRQLPPDVPAFTGRRHEIAELDRLMAQTRDAVTVAASRRSPRTCCTPSCARSGWPATTCRTGWPSERPGSVPCSPAAGC